MCNEMIYGKSNYCNQKHRKNYYRNSTAVNWRSVDFIGMTSNWGEEKVGSCLLDVGRSTLVRETEQRAWRYVCLYFHEMC